MSVAATSSALLLTSVRDNSIKNIKNLLKTGKDEKASFTIDIAHAFFKKQYK